MSSENKVQWIYSSRDNPELAERYDQWAKDYDSDLEQDFGWVGPQQAVEVFSKYVPKDARVLDAGAGTGLVGKSLHELGYRELVAMDLSQGMLDEAHKKGVYLELRRMVMGETLDFPTDHFDGVVSVGVLTVGHAPASSLERAGPGHQARRLHRIHPSAGRVRRQRVQRNPERVGVQREVEAGGGRREVPAPAQR